MDPTALMQENRLRRRETMRRWRWWGVVGAGLIVLAAVGVYWNSFDGVFVLDDNHAIVRNARIRSLWPITGVLRNPRPVLQMSLAINHAAGGLDPWGYHAANLAFHVVAALALYGLLRRTFRRGRIRRRLGAAALPAALVATLIWTVHPLHTGAVTYIIQRAESLMAMFFLLTMYCAVRALSSRRHRAWSGMAVACCALGMGVKEVMVTAPLAVMAWDWAFAGSRAGKLPRRRWLYAALAATWLIVLVRLTTGVTPTSAGFQTAVWTPLSYALTQFGVIVHYLRLTFWPAGQCLDPAWPPAQGLAAVAPPAALVGALAAVTAWALWRRRAWGFAGLWFFLILAPSSSIMPIADAMFEHRVYLSLAAVVAVVVAGAVLVGRRLGDMGVSRVGLSAGGVVAAAVVTAGLGVATLRRNAVYHDDLAMYRDVVAKAPWNPRGHRNLGAALDRRDRMAEAMVHFERAVRLLPNCPQTRNNYAFGLHKTGRVDEAMRQWRMALEIKSDLPEALHAVGVVYGRQGRYGEALKLFERALRASPLDADIHHSVGVALASAGRPAEAVRFFRKALALDPELVDGHYSLGRALAEEGKPGEAAAEFRRQLARDRNHRHALEGLARLMAEQTPPEGGGL